MGVAPARSGWGGGALFLPFSRTFERPVLSEDVRRELAARLGDELEAFRALTGRRFEGWSV